MVPQAIHGLKDSILGRVHITRGDGDRTVPGNSSKSPGITAALAQPGQEGVPQRVQYKRTHLAYPQGLPVLLLEGAGLDMPRARP